MDDIQNRKQLLTQKFDELSKQRDDINSELLRLQGAYAELEDMEKSKDPGTIKAVPAKKGKDK